MGRFVAIGKTMVRTSDRHDYLYTNTLSMLLVNNGASEQHLDDQLISELKERIMDYTELESPCKRAAAGTHALLGTAAGTVTGIVNDREGNKYPAKTPGIIISGLWPHLCFRKQ